MSAALRCESEPDEVSAYAPKWVREPLSPARPTDERGLVDNGEEPAPAVFAAVDSVAPAGGLVIDHFRVPPSLDPTPVPEPWPAPRRRRFGTLLRFGVGALASAAAALFVIGKFPFVFAPDSTPAFTYAAEHSATFGSRFSGQSTLKQAKLEPKQLEPSARLLGTKDIEPQGAPQASAPAAPEAVLPANIAAEPPSPAAVPVTRARTAVIRHLEPDEIADLLRRGEAFIASGDLAAARLVLQRAAEAGDARSALLLASTYDPVSLEKLGVQGFASDVEKARIWYERAREFGSAEAPRRLETLVSREQ